MARILHCYDTEGEATAEFEKFLDIPGVSASRLTRLTALKGEDLHFFRQVVTMSDVRTLLGLTFHGVILHSNISPSAHSVLSTMLRSPSPDDNLQSY